MTCAVLLYNWEKDDQNSSLLRGDKYPDIHILTETKVDEGGGEGEDRKWRGGRWGKGGPAPHQGGLSKYKSLQI